jgi:hypothetical protein
MTLADPDVHARHVARGRPGVATIEVGHAQTRTGIIVELPTGTLSTVRMALESAFDRAGRLAGRRVDDPGWWSALVCAAALDVVGSASVQRTPTRGSTHAVLVVERGSMLHPRPAWPLARLKPDGPWLDLRGETALAVGPSDSELQAYAVSVGIDRPVGDLLRMFEFGVIEWEPTAPAGRRGLRSAGT